MSCLYFGFISINSFPWWSVQCLKTSMKFNAFNVYCPKNVTLEKQRMNWTMETTKSCLSEVLVYDRIFQDKENDSIRRQTTLESTLSCHQQRVTSFMPPLSTDTLQHSISSAMSPLICAFKTKNTFADASVVITAMPAFSSTLRNQPDLGIDISTRPGLL